MSKIFTQEVHHCIFPVKINGNYKILQPSIWRLQVTIHTVGQWTHISWSMD